MEGEIVREQTAELQEMRQLQLAGHELDLLKNQRHVHTREDGVSTGAAGRGESTRQPSARRGAALAARGTFFQIWVQLLLKTIDFHSCVINVQYLLLLKR